MKLSETSLYSYVEDNLARYKQIEWSFSSAHAFQFNLDWITH
jgi:hypothetical protein